MLGQLVMQVMMYFGAKWSNKKLQMTEMLMEILEETMIMAYVIAVLMLIVKF